ncbi:glycosyltransferase [Granulicoccus sp. GXG6511]|uniref:glycosyltransferase n=1 Tax=Granulicoccus sp. GXG6511 TaxID=3381351 RepID=UPI003D7D4D36
MKSPSQESGERLRIAHLTTVDMSLALLLATELQVDLEAGHEVFGISAPGPYVERVEALGLQHVPIDTLTRRWNLLGDARAFVELFRTLRRLKLDVLHTHNPKTGVMGRIAGRLARVPVVVNTCHGLWARPEDPLLKRVLVYGAEALAIRFSDFELFQNAEDAKTLRRFLKKGRWRVVGNGIDLERFKPDPEGRRRVRAELGIADDELLVGTVGRRVREKGLAEYAEAAHALGHRARFIWVGPDDDTDGSAPVPHQEAVHFVGERTDMPAVYSALDVFALPTYREGFSRASMEAAACRVPMVLSDIRGCREIGTSEEHLLLAPAHDADALTAAIARLLEDPTFRARLGATARVRAQAEFDQRQIAQISLDTYASITRNKGLPAKAENHRITVLHVLPQDQERGAQVYAGQLRDALADDTGQRHLVVTLFQSPDAAARADIKLGIAGGLLRRVGMDPRAVLRLRQSLQHEDADLVVAHGGEALKYVVAAAGKTPTVYYKVGLSSAEIARPQHRLLYRALSNRVTRVVGVSRPIVDQVARLFGVPRDRTTLIPNGRDPQRYHPLGNGERPVDPPRVLFVGRLEPGKRPDLFLDVVQDLQSRGLGFSAAIAGDGPLHAALAPRAAALQVELLGSRSDVPELLRRSAVLVMTSAADTEGMPGVLIEAGLSGLPVVSTTAAGVADVLADGRTGAIVPGDSVTELADRVAFLIEDIAERTAWGAAARARCIDLFSLDATAQQWRQLTEELAASQGEVATINGELTVVA